MGDEGGNGTATSRPRPVTSWRFLLLALGLFLTLKGYHSFNGDQAYRLPLLLHHLDPSVYSDDPFVRSFDNFNPHRGTLKILGVSTRAIGLPATLAVLFAATFVLSVWGIQRLAVLIHPGSGPVVGWTAVALFLTAKAGNIGTNHLFEAMLLDRLMALAMGWIATAAFIENPRRGWKTAAPALGVAAWIHPSMGLQLALVLSGAWFAWACVKSRTETDWRTAFLSVGTMALAIVPGLIDNLYPFGNLRAGLSPELFRLLTVELQSPQHMLPSLWRKPQWLAAGAYLVLASVSLIAMRRTTPASDSIREESTSSARWRFGLLLLAVLIWLSASWIAIEILQHIGATVFQPFRIATFGRGLCLVLASGRIVALWRRGGWIDGLRALLILVGCSSDWLFVAVVAIESGMTILDVAGDRVPVAARTLAFLAMLAWAGNFLTKHDTERGEFVLAGATAAGTALGFLRGRIHGNDLMAWPARRRHFVMGVAWAGPTAAAILALMPMADARMDSKLVRGLSARWRFNLTPIAEMETLAIWCRDHTPRDARFIGPPGPKEFRLWSQRSLAFNRAGSPYSAEGIRDWYERFRDHVDFDGSAEEFVRAYQKGRHQLEARYDRMTDDQLATLAIRQGADHVLAKAERGEGSGVLQRLRVEGEYAVYRVQPERLARLQP